MKKQYLIGLLGLVAVSVPMGNSLLNVNSKELIATNNTPKRDQTDPKLKTGISVDTSSITFWDLQTIKEGTPSDGDTLKAIDLNLEYDSDIRSKEKFDETTPANSTSEAKLLTSEDNGLTFSASGGDNSIDFDYKITYAQIRNNKSTLWTYNEELATKPKKEEQYVSKSTLNISIDDLHHSFLNSGNIWNYEYDSTVEYGVSADYDYDSDMSNNGEEGIFDDIKTAQQNLGVDLISYESVTYYEETKIIAVDKSVGQKTNYVYDVTSTSASVDYTVTPGKNYNGKEVHEIESVKWMNDEEELASSTELEGTLKATNLKPGVIYDNTTIVVKMIDDKELVEPFVLDSFGGPDFKYGAPEIGEIDSVTGIDSTTKVTIDDENNILEVNGQIKTNGSKINTNTLDEIQDIKIVKYDSNGQRSETQPVTNEINMFLMTNTDGEEYVQYDIWTPDYIEEGITGIGNYAIEVNYELVTYADENGKELKSPSSTFGNIESNLNTVLSSNVNTDDLKDIIPSSEETKMGAFAIILIIIAVLVGIGIIYIIGKKLYKKYNPSDSDNESIQEEEQVEEPQV